MRTILISILLMTSALAQGVPPQQPTMTEMRAALNASMSQTNTMRDMHLAAEARAAVLVEENARLKAEIEILKKGRLDAEHKP